ncbi:MAG: PilZ domain-containing protein [Candidatus Eremiobacteraeota bacterium]|nr:PilZ domain-containing protein [Candidatus Eremiobacteraeota bacterium]
MQLATQARTLMVNVLRNDGLGVTLTSDSRLPRHETIAVTDSEGNEARVNISDGRRTSERTWLSFGTIYEGWLEEQTPTPPSVPLRSSARSKLHVSVRSEFLPGLEGRTIDLSRDGLQMEVSQPLEVGENVEVVLDLDDGEEPYEAWTSVRWCQMGETCRVGLQFIGATAVERARLEDYLLWHDVEAVGLSSRRERCETTLFRGVSLKDVFRQDEDLVVRLLLGNSEIEQKFVEPLLMKFVKRESALERILRKPLAGARFFYRFLDEEGQIVLGFEAGLPEVTLCAV